MGVVVPARWWTAWCERGGHPATAAALDGAGVAFGTAGRPGRDALVTVVAPPEAKGLEFDAVVVAPSNLRRS